MNLNCAVFWKEGWLDDLREGERGEGKVELVQYMNWKVICVFIW